MTLTTKQKNEISNLVSMTLEDETFSDFLERFDLTPEEVFTHLYESGLIDPDKFEDFVLDIN